MRNKGVAILAGATALTFPFSAAYAQSAPALQQAEVGGIEEIVVTAQKKSESIQDTPLSITALGGADLRAQNITNLADLNNTTPNVNIATVNGTARVTIRGIGTSPTQPGSESNIAYHVDGVYVSRPTSTTNSFFDVDRIEVVRGPQGTLYGRNATGGAINVVTRDPSDTLSGFAEITGGNYELIKAEAGLSVPLAEGISARIAFQSQDRGGYGKQYFPAGAPKVPIGSITAPVIPTSSTGYKEDFDDLKTRAVRAKLKMNTGDLTVLLAGEYFYENDHSGIVRYLGRGPSGLPATDTLYGGLLPDSIRDSFTQFPQGIRKEDYSFTGTVSYAASKEFNLTSITGYRNSSFAVARNQSETQLSTLQNTAGEKGYQISEELRVSGDLGRLSYVLGGFLYHEEQNAESYVAIHNLQFGTRPAATSFLSQGYGAKLRLKTDVAAAFGQISYEFTDWIGVDLGGRYNWERKKKPIQLYGYGLCSPYNADTTPWMTTGSCDVRSSIAPRQVSYKSFKPKFTLRLQPSRDLLFYATYGEAFRSGGYNFGSSVDQRPFLPEELTAYEVGFKGDFLDGRLRTNFAGFHYSYKNLQVARLANDGRSVVTESAGKAEVWGLEASVIALPIPNLRLNLDVGLLDPKFVIFSSTDGSLVTCSNGPLFCQPAYYQPGIDPARNGLAGKIQNLSGNRLIQAPKRSISAGAEYRVESAVGDFTLRGQTSIVSKVFFDAFNNPEVAQKGYALFDASLRFEHNNDHIYASLFVKNITNKDYIVLIKPGGQNTGAINEGLPGAPRTFGGSIGYKF